MWEIRDWSLGMMEPGQNGFLSAEPHFLYIIEEETISAPSSNMEGKTLK